MYVCMLTSSALFFLYICMYVCMCAYIICALFLLYCVLVCPEVEKRRDKQSMRSSCEESYLLARIQAVCKIFLSNCIGTHNRSLKINGATGLTGMNVCMKSMDWSRKNESQRSENCIIPDIYFSQSKKKVRLCMSACACVRIQQALFVTTNSRLTECWRQMSLMRNWSLMLASVNITTLYPFILRM